MESCKMNLVCRCDKCLKQEATTSERVLGWFYSEMQNNFQLCQVFRSAFAGIDPYGVYHLETHINSQCPCCGFTLIHLAISVGSRAHVQYYLQRGIDVNAKNDNGDTALHMAVVSTNWGIIDDLLRHGANLNTLDALGCTPMEILLSSQTQCEIAIGTLLQYGASLNNLFSGNTVEVLNANRRIANGMTPLCDAILRNDAEVLRRLLHNGACPELRLTNESALMMACIEGFDECVLVLLEGGADVFQKDSEGRTALHYAVTADYSSIVATLLRHGCDCEIEDVYGHTALDLAVLGNSVQILELLLDHGARFVYDRDLPFQAIERGASDVLVTLIQRGIIVVDEANEYGDSLLTLAEKTGQHSFVQFLLDNGAEDDFNTPPDAETQSLTPEVLALIY